MSREAQVAQQLEQECDHFLAHYATALPRVVDRELHKILKTLGGLARERAPGAVGVLVFQFLMADGVRLNKKDGDSLADAQLVCEVLYDIEGERMVYRSTPVASDVITAIYQAMVASAGGVRTIDTTQLVEIGVSPNEVVEFVKKIAFSAAFTNELARATQKPAQA